jgi:hypothetical protein
MSLSCRPIAYHNEFGYEQIQVRLSSLKGRHSLRAPSDEWLSTIENGSSSMVRPRYREIMAATNDRARAKHEAKKKAFVMKLQALKDAEQAAHDAADSKMNNNNDTSTTTSSIQPNSNSGDPGASTASITATTTTTTTTSSSNNDWVARRRSAVLGLGLGVLMGRQLSSDQFDLKTADEQQARAAELDRQHRLVFGQRRRRGSTSSVASTVSTPTAGNATPRTPASGQLHQVNEEDGTMEGTDGNVTRPLAMSTTIGESVTTKPAGTFGFTERRLLQDIGAQEQAGPYSYAAPVPRGNGTLASHSHMAHSPIRYRGPTSDTIQRQEALLLTLKQTRQHADTRTIDTANFRRRIKPLTNTPISRHARRLRVAEMAGNPSNIFFASAFLTLLQFIWYDVILTQIDSYPTTPAMGAPGRLAFRASQLQHAHESLSHGGSGGGTAVHDAWASSSTTPTIQSNDDVYIGPGTHTIDHNDRPKSTPFIGPPRTWNNERLVMESGRGRPGPGTYTPAPPSWRPNGVVAFHRGSPREKPRLLVHEEIRPSIGSYDDRRIDSQFGWTKPNDPYHNPHRITTNGGTHSFAKSSRFDAPGGHLPNASSNNSKGGPAIDLAHGLKLDEAELAGGDMPSMHQVYPGRSPEHYAALFPPGSSILGAIVAKTVTTPAERKKRAEMEAKARADELAAAEKKAHLEAMAALAMGDDPLPPPTTAIAMNSDTTVASSPSGSPTPPIDSRAPTRMLTERSRTSMSHPSHHDAAIKSPSSSSRTPRANGKNNIIVRNKEHVGDAAPVKKAAELQNKAAAHQ